MINKLIQSLLILFCLTVQLSYCLAQDAIFKKNGDEINAYVEEVGLESVKYKTASNRDGASMFLANSELLLIKFENGEKHVFSQSQSSNAKYQLGQSMGGGIIFYIDESGEHGLIAAPEDIGGLHKWGRAQRRIGASNYADGMRNTEVMNQEYGSSFAGGKCANLNVAGYDDWYLPAIDELERLYRNRNYIPSLDAIGRTRNRFDYVSSTEYKNRNDCWAIHFSRGGKHFYYNKRNEYSVRCVRKF